MPNGSKAVDTTLFITWFANKTSLFRLEAVQALTPAHHTVANHALDML